MWMCCKDNLGNNDFSNTVAPGNWKGKIQGQKNKACYDNMNQGPLLGGTSLKCLQSTGHPTKQPKSKPPAQPSTGLSLEFSYHFTQNKTQLTWRGANRSRGDTQPWLGSEYSERHGGSDTHPQRFGCENNGRNRDFLSWYQMYFWHFWEGTESRKQF